MVPDDPRPTLIPVNSDEINSTICLLLRSDTLVFRSSLSSGDSISTPFKTISRLCLRYLYETVIFEDRSAGSDIF